MLPLNAASKGRGRVTVCAQIAPPSWCRSGESQPYRIAANICPMHHSSAHQSRAGSICVAYLLTRIWPTCHRRLLTADAETFPSSRRTRIVSSDSAFLSPPSNFLFNLLLIASSRQAQPLLGAERPMQLGHTVIPVIHFLMPYRSEGIHLD